MIFNHQVLKIFNLLKGMCIMYIYIYMIIVLNTGHGIFQIKFMLHFDQKIS